MSSLPPAPSAALSFRERLQLQLNKAKEIQKLAQLDLDNSKKEIQQEQPTLITRPREQRPEINLESLRSRLQTHMAPKVLEQTNPTPIILSTLSKTNENKENINMAPNIVAPLSPIKKATKLETEQTSLEAKKEETAIKDPTSKDSQESSDQDGCIILEELSTLKPLQKEIEMTIEIETVSQPIEIQKEKEETPQQLKDVETKPNEEKSQRIQGDLLVEQKEPVQDKKEDSISNEVKLIDSLSEKQIQNEIKQLSNSLNLEVNNEINQNTLNSPSKQNSNESISQEEQVQLDKDQVQIQSNNQEESDKQIIEPSNEIESQIQHKTNESCDIIQTNQPTNITKTEIQEQQIAIEGPKVEDSIKTETQTISIMTIINEPGIEQMQKSAQIEEIQEENDLICAEKQITSNDSKDEESSRETLQIKEINEFESNQVIETEIENQFESNLIENEKADQNSKEQKIIEVSDTNLATEQHSNNPTSLLLEKDITESNEKILIEDSSSPLNKTEVQNNQSEVNTNIQVSVIQEQDNLQIIKEDKNDSLDEIKPLLVIEEEDKLEQVDQRTLIQNNQEEKVEQKAIENVVHDCQETNYQQNDPLDLNSLGNTEHESAISTTITVMEINNNQNQTSQLDDKEQILKENNEKILEEDIKIDSQLEEEDTQKQEHIEYKNIQEIDSGIQQIIDIQEATILGHTEGVQHEQQQQMEIPSQSNDSKDMQEFKSNSVHDVETLIEDSNQQDQSKCEIEEDQQQEQEEEEQNVQMQSPQISERAIPEPKSVEKEQTISPSKNDHNKQHIEEANQDLDTKIIEEVEFEAQPEESISNHNDDLKMQVLDTQDHSRAQPISETNERVVSPVEFNNQKEESLDKQQDFADQQTSQGEIQSDKNETAIMKGDSEKSALENQDISQGKESQPNESAVSQQDTINTTSTAIQFDHEEQILNQPDSSYQENQSLLQQDQKDIIIQKEPDENLEGESKTESEVVQISENIEKTIETSRKNSINQSNEQHQEIIIEEHNKDEQLKEVFSNSVDEILNQEKEDKGQSNIETETEHKIEVDRLTDEITIVVNPIVFENVQEQKIQEDLISEKKHETNHESNLIECDNNSNKEEEQDILLNEEPLNGSIADKQENNNTTCQSEGEDQHIQTDEQNIEEEEEVDDEEEEQEQQEEDQQIIEKEDESHSGSKLTEQHNEQEELETVCEEDQQQEFQQTLSDDQDQEQIKETNHVSYDVPPSQHVETDQVEQTTTKEYNKAQDESSYQSKVINDLIVDNFVGHLKQTEMSIQDQTNTFQPSLLFEDDKTVQQKESEEDISEVNSLGNSKEQDESAINMQDQINKPLKENSQEEEVAENEKSSNQIILEQVSNAVSTSPSNLLKYNTVEFTNKQAEHDSSSLQAKDKNPLNALCFSVFGDDSDNILSQMDSFITEKSKISETIQIQQSPDAKNQENIFQKIQRESEGKQQNGLEQSIKDEISLNQMNVNIFTPNHLKPAASQEPTNQFSNDSFGITPKKIDFFSSTHKQQQELLHKSASKEKEPSLKKQKNQQTEPLKQVQQGNNSFFNKRSRSNSPHPTQQTTSLHQQQSASAKSPTNRYQAGGYSQKYDRERSRSRSHSASKSPQLLETNINKFKKDKTITRDRSRSPITKKSANKSVIRDDLSISSMDINRFDYQEESSEKAEEVEVVTQDLALELSRIAEILGIKKHNRNQVEFIESVYEQKQNVSKLMLNQSGKTILYQTIALMEDSLPKHFIVIVTNQFLTLRQKMNKQVSWACLNQMMSVDLLVQVQHLLMDKKVKLLFTQVEQLTSDQCKFMKGQIKMIIYEDTPEKVIREINQMYGISRYHLFTTDGFKTLENLEDTCQKLQLNNLDKQVQLFGFNFSHIHWSFESDKEKSFLNFIRKNNLKKVLLFVDKSRKLDDVVSMFNQKGLKMAAYSAQRSDQLQQLFSKDQFDILCLHNGTIIPKGIKLISQYYIHYHLSRSVINYLSDINGFQFYHIQGRGVQFDKFACGFLSEQDFFEIRATMIQELTEMKLIQNILKTLNSNGNEPDQSNSGKKRQSNLSSQGAVSDDFFFNVVLDETEKKIKDHYDSLMDGEKEPFDKEVSDNVKQIQITKFLNENFVKRDTLLRILSYIAADKVTIMPFQGQIQGASKQASQTNKIISTILKGKNSAVFNILESAQELQTTSQELHRALKKLASEKKIQYEVKEEIAFVTPKQNIEKMLDRLFEEIRFHEEKQIDEFDTMYITARLTCNLTLDQVFKYQKYKEIPKGSSQPDDYSALNLKIILEKYLNQTKGKQLNDIFSAAEKLRLPFISLKSQREKSNLLKDIQSLVPRITKSKLNLPEFQLNHDISLIDFDAQSRFVAMILQGIEGKYINEFKATLQFKKYFKYNYFDILQIASEFLQTYFNQLLQSATTKKIKI